MSLDKTSDEIARTTVRISEPSDDRREAVVRGRRVVESLLNSRCQLLDRILTYLGAAINKTGARLVEVHNTGKSMRYVAIILCASSFGEE